MKFQDPSPCRCTSCGVESKLQVRDLLALTALCPNCGASFRETGMDMRRTVDEVSTSYNAMLIIMHIEEELGITIPEEMEEPVCTSVDVTLHDLAMIVNRCGATPDFAKAEQAVRSAVRAEIPNAPESLDFSAPLLSAILPNRKYGGY